MHKVSFVTGLVNSLKTAMKLWGLLMALAATTPEVTRRFSDTSFADALPLFCHPFY